MHRIKIGGVTYANVGDIQAKKEYKYYHQVETLDGVLHEKIRYTKTNYEVTFFNLLDGVYDGLKAFIDSHEDMAVVCGIPQVDGTFDEREYRIEITDEKMKGYHRGIYYKNGLALLLKAVLPDE